MARIRVKDFLLSLKATNHHVFEKSRGFVGSFRLFTTQALVVLISALDLLLISTSIFFNDNSNQSL
jgi:hypothetical protein